MALRSTPHLFITTLLKFTQLLVAWRRHRAELLEACPPGRRPWGFWMVERRLKHRPGGEVGELRAIRQFELYRDEEERVYVEQRLAEIMEGIRTRRGSPAAHQTAHRASAAFLPSRSRMR